MSSIAEMSKPLPYGPGTMYPAITIRRANKLNQHAAGYANFFVSSFRAGELGLNGPHVDIFTKTVTEAMIPGMCAGMCEATFTRARDKAIVAEQIAYVRACAEHWCAIFLKMTNSVSV